MDLGLTDKIAVIFASSKGLGRAAAESLAAEGCNIAICSRDKFRIAAVAEHIKITCHTDVYCENVNVEYSEQVEQFLHNVIQRWGRVDILVTNAGGPPVKSFLETTSEEWDKYFRITFMSVVTALKVVIPQMKKQKSGRVINITSISVKEPVPGLIYSNSLRLAVVGLAKTLANELGPYGITIHNVAPGYHRTEGLERIVKKRLESGEKREDIYTAWEGSVPLRRVGEPADLAALITFLASGQAGYMTGTTIQVDGGKYSGSL
jgi:3-oxoacyl-[acyl-carrier protein] reductase